MVVFAFSQIVYNSSDVKHVCTFNNKKIKFKKKSNIPVFPTHFCLSIQ